MGKTSKFIKTVGIFIIIFLFVFAGLFIADIIIRYKDYTMMNEVILTSAENHDLVLNDNGIFGYTAVDVQDPILDKARTECKLEVLSVPISDVIVNTKAGLFNLGVFSKMQYIIIHHDAQYMVDLSKMSKRDIYVDKDNKEITIYIPHPELEEIKVSESDAEFGDTKKGLLAFGEITMTAEEHAAVEREASNKLTDKVMNSDIPEQADKYAKLAVYSLFNPLIESVSKEYSLTIEFSD